MGRFTGLNINPQALGGKGFFSLARALAAAPGVGFSIAPAGSSGAPGCPCNPFDVGFSSVIGFGTVNPTTLFGGAIRAALWTNFGPLFNLAVLGNFPQNQFTQVALPDSDAGAVSFLSAAAVAYGFDGTQTSWNFSAPVQLFTAAHTYTVNFS